MKKAMGNKMGYCPDALKLLKIKVICGKDCPLIGGKCPRNIMQDAVDDGVTAAILAMMEVMDGKPFIETTKSYTRYPRQEGPK